MTGAPEERWRARPVLAGLLRAALLLVPLGASGLAVLAVDRAAPAHPDPAWLWLGLAMSTAVLTGVTVERAVRRLTPLPVLLRLDLLFPAAAPSRYRVARDAVTRSQERLARTPSGTAEQVMRLIGALGAHDRRTRGHCERVRVLTDLLAVEMRLGAADRDRLRWAALLHDLGKLNVPPGLLNKASRLSVSEFDTVKAHPEVGAALAAPLLPWLGESGLGIVEHHEKYDGSGYPAGLAGSGISLAGRMVALVDAFETMTAARSYKKAMATAAARTELAACSGTHFDPVCVRAFLAVPLPRLLWAMGPVSFALQVPFLRMLAEAGRLGASASAAAGPAAAGVAGAAAIAVTGLGAVPALPPSAGGGSGPLALGVSEPAAASFPAAPDAALVVGPPTSVQQPPPPAPAPAAVVGPPTGVEPTNDRDEVVPPSEPVLPVEAALPVEVGPLAPAAPVLGPATGLAPVSLAPELLSPETLLDPSVPLTAPELDPVAEPVAEVLAPVLEPVVGPVVEAIETVLDAVAPELDPVLETVDPVLGPVLETVDPVLEPVLDTVDPVLDTVEPVLEPVVVVLEPVLETLDPVLETVEPVVGVLEPLVDTVDAAQPLDEAVMETLDPVVDTLVDSTEPVLDTVSGTLPLGDLLGG